MPSATGWLRDHAITATPAAAPSASAATRHTRRGAASADHSANTPTAGISCSVNRSRYTANPATRPLPASHSGPHRPATARAASQTARTAAVMLHCRGAYSATPLTDWGAKTSGRHASTAPARPTAGATARRTVS